MYRQKKIKIPIYYADFYIIDTDDISQLRKRHGIEVDDELFAQTFFATPRQGDVFIETHYAIFNYSRPEGFKPELDTIAHEAFHLTVNLFERRDIRLDWTNDEPYAYMIGWFVREITEFLYKKAEG